MYDLLKSNPHLIQVKSDSSETQHMLKLSCIEKNPCCKITTLDELSSQFGIFLSQIISIEHEKRIPYSLMPP